jgi:hypothetical protein
MTEANLTTFQRVSLSALLVTNEKMVASGELDIERAVTLRWLISQTLSAFQMPAVYERGTNDNKPDDEYERDLSVIRGLMDASSIWDAGR